MKKNLIAGLLGIILFIIGIFYQIPSEELTTYSWVDGASHIEEYVGGDAYNYIIGANLVGAKITGAIVAKAIYISIGVLLISLSIILPRNQFCSSKKDGPKTTSGGDVNQLDVPTTEQE